MVNQCTLVGRLGGLPKAITLGSGKLKVSATLALQRGGKSDQTNWINLVLWEEDAKRFMEWYGPQYQGDEKGGMGRTIFVSGEWTTNKVVNNDDNTSRTYHECVVRQFRNIPGDIYSSLKFCHRYGITLEQLVAGGFSGNDYGIFTQNLGDTTDTGAEAPKPTPAASAQSGSKPVGSFPKANAGAAKVQNSPAPAQNSGSDDTGIEDYDDPFAFNQS